MRFCRGIKMEYRLRDESYCEISSRRILLLSFNYCSIVLYAVYAVVVVAECLQMFSTFTLRKIIEKKNVEREKTY